MICPKLELLEGPMVVVAVSLFGARRGNGLEMGLFVDWDPRIRAVETRKEPIARSRVGGLKVHSKRC